jgi:hypothetical protein
MILYEKKIEEVLNKFDDIDQSLISSRDLIRNFGTEEDYIEAHVYSYNNVLLYSNYNFTEYKVPGTLKAEDETTTNYLEFSPGKLIETIGYLSGKYKVVYNVLRKKVINANVKIFFIKSISSDRTELRVASNLISDSSIQEGTLNFINEFQNSSYYKDFLINFGDNKLINAVNIALDTSVSPYTILIKLYKPLPTEFIEKTSFWLVEEMSTPATFEVEVTPDVIEEKIPFLRSANFNIELDYTGNTLSDYYNNQDLVSNTSLFAYQQLLGKLKDKGIKISVDYQEYENFIHFSSATRRLLNFVNKIQKVEDYNTEINYIKNSPSYSGSISVSQSVYSIQQQLSDIILNFDDYEKFLYYESSSKSWPKSGSLKPYSLYPVGSQEVSYWLGSLDYNSIYYGGQIYSASQYDGDNQNNLLYSIPEYLRIDDNSEEFNKFVEMMGQYFDSIWLYIKSITDLSIAKNNVNKGISKDLVYYALRSLGIKLYNSKANQSLYEYLIGSNESGSYANESDNYNTLISSSYDKISGEDIQKEILKRIYHNIPSLLKKKGTNDGIDDLISIYGIPYTVLSPTQFGGSDKSNQTVEYVYDRFSYSLYNTSSSYVSIPWDTLYYPTIPDGDLFVPDTVEVRFKPDKNTYYHTSSLIEVVSVGSTDRSFGVLIRPDSSLGHPYSKVEFYLNGNSGYYSSSITLPIYNEDVSGDLSWWNIMIRRQNHTSASQNSVTQYYDVFVANKIDTYIGHQGSSSIFIGSVSPSYNESWSNSNQNLYLGGSGIQDDAVFKSVYKFTGQLQEFRYWATPISQSRFIYHTLNPESIEGNNTTSSYYELSARYALGNDLKYYNHYVSSSVFSIHPNQEARVFDDTSVSQSATFLNFGNNINYLPNIEEYVADSPNSVYSIPVNKKIRIVSNSITGSVLSSFSRLEEDFSKDYTKDTHYTDVSFSPQNEINKDIIAQYGNTIDLDQLIGDPRQLYMKEYPELVTLSLEYFKKYTDRYNYKEFIKLIQYYDNALFKMILDFVPARDNISTGLTIKSPILERPKAKTVQLGGEPKYNYVESSITGSKIEANSIYTSGVDDGKDFYTGELKGSSININTLFSEKNRNPYL